MTTKLSPQEAKALEMLNNGFSRADICDEMLIEQDHLRALFCNIRRKGIHVPKGKGGGRYEGKVPLKRLVQIYNTLEASGFYGAGIYRVMSERTGLSANCIKVRMWRYKNGGRVPLYARQREQAA